MSNDPGIQTEIIAAYINQFGLREPDLLRDLREETVKRQRGFLLQPATGQLLDFLMKSINAKKFLDVGCFTGYSALIAAFAGGKDARVISMDVNTDWTQLAKEFWHRAKVDSQIELKIAPALETLKTLRASGEEGKFDFAFIDADKSNYFEYVENCAALVRRGGIIALDNTLWRGQVALSETTDKTAVLFRDLNSRLQRDERFDFMILPVGDGVTVLRKR